MSKATFVPKDRYYQFGPIVIDTALLSYGPLTKALMRGRKPQPRLWYEEEDTTTLEAWLRRQYPRCRMW